jgi:hypothetical protein
LQTNHISTVDHYKTTNLLSYTRIIIICFKCNETLYFTKCIKLNVVTPGGDDFETVTPGGDRFPKGIFALDVDTGSSIPCPFEMTDISANGWYGCLSVLSPAEVVLM